MKLIYILLFSLCLFSCTTEKKATNWMLSNPKALSSLCAAQYPAKTEYIKGEETIKLDTVSVPGDSIPCPETKDTKGNTYTPKVKCPDSKTIYVDRMRIDTLVKIDSARAVSLRLILEQSIANTKQLQYQNSNLIKWLIIGILACILLIFVIISIIKK